MTPKIIEEVIITNDIFLLRTTIKFVCVCAYLCVFVQGEERTDTLNAGLTLDQCLEKIMTKQSRAWCKDRRSGDPS